MLDSLGDTVPPYLVAAALQQQVGGAMAETLALLRNSSHPAADDIAAKLGGPDALAARKSRTAGKKGRGRTDAVCQLKISLRNVAKPSIWRRVIVPGDLTLGDLHHMIIQAMGWDDAAQAGQQAALHLRLRRRLGARHPVGEAAAIGRGRGAPLVHRGWGYLPARGLRRSLGYDNLKKVVADPDDEEHDEMLDWLDLDSSSEFDPAAFSLEEVNTRLGRFR